MDLESTLETIAGFLPEDLTLQEAITTVAGFLPEGLNLEEAVEGMISLIPAELDFVTMAKFLLIFSAGSLVMSLLGRVMLGKRSSLNHSLSSVMGILFIYAVTIVVYTFKPWNLENFLSPLPFVSFSGEYLVIFPIQGAQFPALCSQILSLVILAFLVNLLDSFIPKGDDPVSWYLWRFVTIVLAMGLHLVVHWAIGEYLPEVLVTYAPMILLILLISTLLLGVVNLVLGLVLTVMDPILGAIYAFFFSNIIGKQLTKAVFTSAILCVIFFLMEYFGYTIICISITSLGAYIPLAVVSLVLWYLIGHLL